MYLHDFGFGKPLHQNDGANRRLGKEGLRDYFDYAGAHYRTWSLNVAATFCPCAVVQVCDECLKSDHPEKCATRPRPRANTTLTLACFQMPPQAREHAAVAFESKGRSRPPASRRGTHYNPLSKRRLNVVPVDCGAGRSRKTAPRRGPGDASPRIPRHFGRRLRKGLPQLLHRGLHQAHRAAHPLLHPRPDQEHAARLRRRRPLRRRRERILNRFHRTRPQRLFPRTPPAPRPAPPPGTAPAASS